MQRLIPMGGISFNYKLGNASIFSSICSQQKWHALVLQWIQAFRRSENLVSAGNTREANLPTGFGKSNVRIRIERIERGEWRYRMQIWIFDCRGRSCAYLDKDGGQPQRIAPTNFISKFSNAWRIFTKREGWGTLKALSPLGRLRQRALVVGCRRGSVRSCFSHRV